MRHFEHLKQLAIDLAYKSLAFVEKPQHYQVKCALAETLRKSSIFVFSILDANVIEIIEIKPVASSSYV